MEYATTLNGNDAVRALSHRDLVPPPRPAQLVDGATAELRDAMARFAGVADHRTRRQVLLHALETIDLVRISRLAATIMTERLDGSAADIVAASWVVPTYTLATVFGLAPLREQVRADTERVARVIGRNQPSSPDSDEAAERLLGLFADQQDPVVPVSLLYQNHDASSGLMRSAVLAAMSDATPTSCGRTVRVATAEVNIGEVTLDRGAQVAINLTGMRYGAGPHRCPGEDLANALVDGVIEALKTNDYRCNPDLVDIDKDGFPTRFIMEAPR